MKHRKVIGIGETVLDIIFNKTSPVAAKPGGSSFNALISLGRMKVPTTFISDIGNDKVGDIIIDFLKENHIDANYVNRHDECKTSLALAFLDKNSDAEYEFYKDYLNQNPNTALPEINENDILLFGSFYAINPNIRPILKALLTKAKKNKAIIYYDPNFRQSHLHELDDLRETIFENMNFATIVRGSDEDFENILGTSKVKKVYEQISPYCQQLMITQNSNGVVIKTRSEKIQVAAKEITPLSTIGAGDSFNAGFIYALIRNNISHKDLENMTSDMWSTLVRTAIEFSTTVCLSYDNYVPKDFKIH